MTLGEKLGTEKKTESIRGTYLVNKCILDRLFQGWGARPKAVMNTINLMRYVTPLDYIELTGDGTKTSLRRIAIKDK